MNRAVYLKRIGINGTDLSPTIETLKQLQRQHLLNVPFENLDIHWKRPIVLDTDWFYKKIVEENRGGFCYELNGLFNELLREIGFDTRLVSARVYNAATKLFGPEFDHMMIAVSIGDQEYVADVGFGDFIAEPLRIAHDIEQTDREGVFVVRGEDGDVFVVAKKVDGAWVPECMFGIAGRQLSEFAGMCEFHQQSPDSHFTKGKLCSLMTEQGRKTLTEKSFVVTVKGEKTEISIESEREFDNKLKDEFGIERK